MIERAEPENTIRPRESDKAELYLKMIGEIFNISDIIEEPQEEPQVVNYYLMNKLPFRFLVSWGGFIHSGISTTVHTRGMMLKSLRASLSVISTRWTQKACWNLHLG